MTLVRPPSPGDPLRIMVVGSSVAMMVVPHRSDRTEGTYGEVLADLLTERGVPAQTTLRCRWFGLVHDARHRYESVRDATPHVVVLNFGMGEAQPHVVPTWLVRHFGTWDPSSTAAGRWYRRHLAPTLWRIVRSWQRFAARLDRGLTYRLRPARFRWEMEHLVGLVRSEIGALVLVLDLDGPGDRVLHWIPGQDRRARRYDRILAEVVADLDDPQVRLVRASETLDGRMSELLPDGFHRNAEGHRETARVLADEVLTWLEGEGLTPVAATRDRV